MKYNCYLIYLAERESTRPPPVAQSPVLQDLPENGVGDARRALRRRPGAACRHHGDSAEEAPDHLGRFGGHGRSVACEQGPDAEHLLVVLQNVLLGHIDVLVSSRARPNDQRLYLAGVALAAPQAVLATATHVDVGDKAESRAAPLADDAVSPRPVTKAVFVDRRPLNDEFSVTLRAADGSRILRFASSAAFSGAGVLIARRGALDVFPQYRSPIPPRADVELRLDLRRADGDAQAPLLPAAHDALAVGLDAALGGPIGGGAYDLAQKCDVEIWVAAAALRAVGGDAAAARLFVDESPGLLCTPGPDDDTVVPFKRGDVVPPAPRRKPPRRRGLSLPPVKC